MSADNSPRTSNPPAQSTPSSVAARDPHPKRRSLLEIGILAGVLLAVIVAGVIVAARAQHGTVPVTWTVYVASDDGYMYALDGKTGAVRWRHHGEGNRPVIADGMVYFLSRAGNSNSSTIDALRTSDGSLAWTYPLANFPSFASVIVDNGIVYEATEGFNGSGPGVLIALEASSGKLLWQKSFDHSLAPFPSIRDGVLCVSTGDGLYALHASDGSFIWRAIVGNYAHMVVQADQAVYLSSGGEVYALDASDGHALWAVYSDPYGVGPLAVAEGTVYAASYKLYALDAQTGAVRWTYQAAQGIPNPPIVADGVVFFRDSNHYVYAVSAADGQLVWRQPKDDDADESIALAHGIVYVGGLNGLYALRAGDGTGLWRFQTSHFLFSPAVGP